MKKLSFVIILLLLLSGCMGRITQLEKSGLNIDTDSNDAVDTVYGGTNIDGSSESGFPRYDSGVVTVPEYLYENFTAFSDNDTTPDVSAHMNFRCSYSSSTTITDFDGTGLDDGRFLYVYFDEDMAGDVTIDLTSSGIEAGNRARDLPVKAGELHIFQYSTDDNQWHMLTAPDDNLKHLPIAFDPDAVCDGDVDRLFLMTVNNTNGVKITEWSLSCQADPDPELDIDLKRADAYIGVGNSAVMDVCDTTTGTSSETTEANINGDAAVADTKVIYLEFGTAYTDTGNQCIFEMWYEEVR